ncbi:unnamed protein product, partial [Prorocentrum cordatum]
QERVYDSFNANDARAGSTVELIDAILRGERAVTDLPLIRVAKKRGVYWCVDNRRCFVYKHCQLGKIPMQVFDWKDRAQHGVAQIEVCGRKSGSDSAFLFSRGGYQVAASPITA